MLAGPPSQPSGYAGHDHELAETRRGARLCLNPPATLVLTLDDNKNSLYHDDACTKPPSPTQPRHPTANAFPLSNLSHRYTSTRARVAPVALRLKHCLSQTPAVAVTKRQTRLLPSAIPYPGRLQADPLRRAIQNRNNAPLSALCCE